MEVLFLQSKGSPENLAIVNQEIPLFYSNLQSLQYFTKFTK